MKRDLYDKREKLFSRVLREIRGRYRPTYRTSRVAVGIYHEVAGAPPRRFSRENSRVLRKEELVSTP